MTPPTYPYAEGKLLEKPNTYFYTPFQGTDFIQAWLASRKRVLDACVASLEEPVITERQGEKPVSSTQKFLLDTLEALRSGHFDAGHSTSLDLLLRNFEAKKKLFEDYQPGFQSRGRQDCFNLQLYLAFAEVLDTAYTQTQRIQYLNGLIKAIDILCAYEGSLAVAYKVRLAALLTAEARHVARLAGELGVDMAVKL